MPRRNPDANYFNTRRASAAPTHPVERALWQMLHEGGEDKIVAYALEVYLEPFERAVLQAFILALATDSTIEERLRVPVEVTQAYRHLFFDLTVFRDELDLLNWVRKQTVEDRVDAETAQLMKMAINNGVDGLSWLYGRGEYIVDAQKVMQQVMTDTFFRGRAHKGNAVASKESQASHGYLQSAFKAAQTVGKLNAPTSVQSLLMKLRYREMTTPVNEAVKNGEILH